MRSSTQISLSTWGSKRENTQTPMANSTQIEIIEMNTECQRSSCGKNAARDSVRKPASGL